VTVTSGDATPTTLAGPEATTGSTAADAGGADPEKPPGSAEIAFTPAIAFARVFGGGVWVMDADGSDYQRVSTGAERLVGLLRWSLDSTRIAFLSVDGLWIVSEPGVDLAVVGVWRHELHRLPRAVVSEAIADAVAHRSYAALGEAVRVKMRPGRVVVRSPGGLPRGVSPGQSFPPIRPPQCAGHPDTAVLRCR